MRAGRSNLLLTALLTLSGCISAGVAPEAPPVPTSVLLDGAGLPFERIDAPVPDMLAISPSMQRFVDGLVADERTPLARWEALAAAITSQSTLALVYTEATVTAIEAFEGGEGNCLSYSAMLIALARHAGLDARFREVDVPPDWSRREGVMIRWNHINVLLDLGQHGGRILDFGAAGDLSGYAGDVVSDARALAHFVNNLGVEQMEKGDSARALGHFRSAVELDPSFSLPWDNIGTIYSRHGFYRQAEASYLHALEINSRDLTAMHNLVRLYDLQGRHDASDSYQARVDRYRDRNPYYHYGLAVQALEGGNFDSAERHLREAIRRKPDEARFEALRSEIRERRATGGVWAQQAALVPAPRD